MIQTLLQIWELRFKSDNQALGDLTKEHARFASGVYQDAIFDTKEKAFSGVKIPKKA